MTVDSHRDLLVWQKAVDLTVEIYRATEGFPRAERFGLTSQIRRAAASIAANIAEGRALGTHSQFLRCLWIASGSANELDTHLVIALRLNFIDQPTFVLFDERLKEIGRMLTGLRRSLS